MVDYVNSCSICARNKSRQHWSYSYLKQLPIPLQPWDSISIDFIEQLPPSDGFTEILMIIDQLTKQAVFIPAYRSINTPGLAYLFIQHIFSKHRVPSHITLDKRSEFVSRFFKSLATTLQMKLYHTSDYHPEADGQTKRTNQTLEQYLRTYCNYQQLDWVQLLPLAEFTYNNVSSATMKESLFFANKGYHPQLQI